MKGGPQSPEGAKTPRHVAIIMDGNGRWARRRNLPRLAGHEEGSKSVVAVLLAAKELGIPYLTLYAFSVENWSRPRSEVNHLFRLLRDFVRRNEKKLHKHRIRLRVMGRIEDLPASVREDIEGTVQRTAGYTDWHCILALSYGARTEIAQAARRIAEEACAGRLDPASVDEQVVARHLYLPDVPDPDLVIRTSGEMRLSNFLLWQASYAEFYCTDVLWPDFREPHLREAVAAYARRRRRFGGLEETAE